MTSEQLEVARAERMRHNGHGTLTLEDACTWLEETGLCLFLPRRQYAATLAPSFVEAVAGQRNSTPDPRQIALAEELLVRLETQGTAVRLNLLGQPGEQPDYVVAAWVLPYVYALRGDRDWRRTPQLTGSRAVSPLAIQLYKRLESAGDATVAELRQALGQGVSDVGVMRAITELWQQLRIIPVIAAPGKAARWQLLRHRFQKAIAEGASTSQVTAISVLASIFLQAVIAASMEEVEQFLSPLTARSKIREVLRGLVATRQVHTLSLGHAPHFYVAGTLPEFAPTTTVYASSIGSAYLAQLREEESYSEPAARVTSTEEPETAQAASNGNSARTHFAHTNGHSRDRKPAAHTARRNAEGVGARTAGSRNGSSSHGTSSHGNAHWSGTKKPAHKSNGHAPAKNAKSNGTERPTSGARTAKAAAPAWKSRSGSHATPAGKKAAAPAARKDVRPASRNGRKPALASAGTSKRFGMAAKGTKKHG